MITGVSYDQYKSNKDRNDEVLKQTIAQSIAYDVQGNDVSSIAMAAEGLSALTNDTSALTLLYSVKKDTYVFNDVELATAAFITALNDSLSTGEFDTEVRMNGAGSGLQSVTTLYALFTTASPTSSPTSTPTSQPTHQDLVIANILSTPLDARVTKAKVKYYLGAFVAYFLGIYMLLYLYSFTGVGKRIARRLYDSSFESHSKFIDSKAAADATSMILRDLQDKNELVSNMMTLESTIKLVRESNRKKDSVSNSESSRDKRGLNFVSRSGRLINDVFQTEDEGKYSRGYREYMQQERTLLGCAPLLYPNGYTLRLPYLDPIALPPGRLEDFILYLCHNHPLFSCFYFMDGSKLGAHGSRILYIGKDIVVFVLYQFSNLLLQYYMLDGRGLGLIIDILLITPSAVLIGLVLKYLYICPFTETVEFQRRYADYQWLVICFGRLSILPIMLIMSSALIIACVFSSGRRIDLVIVNFFVYVQFFGIVVAIADTTLVFVDQFYLRVSVCRAVDIARVGLLFKERIMAEGLVMDVDYAYRIYHYLNGFVVIEKILNRDQAIKAKWINTANEAVDVEMPSTSYKVENPIRESVQQQQQAIVEEEVSYSIYDVETKPEESTSTPAMPLADLVSNLFFNKQSSVKSIESGDTSVFATSAVTENPLRDPSRSNQCSSTPVTEETDEEEASLYQEYQVQCALSTNTDDDYRCKDDETLSFEEWKSNRKESKKEFKKGTRGSFIQAYQLFEEMHQSQEVSVPTEPVNSARHTMHLFSGNAKNVLNTRSSTHK